MHEKDPERAAELLGAARRLFEEVGVAVDPDEAATQEEVVAYARAELGEQRFEKAVAGGAALTFESAIGLIAA
jgi:hypothetical protein